jgi:hypothetical protein
MSDEQEDLRATIDDIAADAHELAAVEQAKKSLDPSDPRAAELSGRAEELGRRLAAKTRAERQLTDEARREDVDRPH